MGEFIGTMLVGFLVGCVPGTITGVIHYTYATWGSDGVAGAADRESFLKEAFSTHIGLWGFALGLIFWFMGQEAWVALLDRVMVWFMGQEAWVALLDRVMDFLGQEPWGAPVKRVMEFLGFWD